MDLPINLSTGTLKPRYLFKSQVSQPLFPQKMQFRAAEGILEHPGQGWGWEGRNPSGFTGSRGLWNRSSALSARAAPSSLAVRQEAPLRKVGGALEEWRQDPPQARDPAAASTERKPPELATGK